MTQTAATERVEILGTAIDPVTVDEAVSLVEDLIDRKQFAYVVTPNVDHLMKLQRDAEFREVYSGASLVVADGVPLIWAAKYLGTPLPGRCNGTDLMVRLCERASDTGRTVFFLGGAEGAAEQARDVLVAKHPGLEVVGTYCPPFGFERDEAENDRIVDTIRAAEPDLLFVGLGAPKQEFWIAGHGSKCGPMVALGIGVSFSLIGGGIRRAPVWMQRSGLEWFWRMIQEPKRLVKRYLVDDLPFFWHVWRQKQGRRRK